MECKTPSNCLIQFYKSYTPVVYYLNPPVIYHEATTELWFDPINTLALIQDLRSD